MSLTPDALHAEAKHLRDTAPPPANWRTLDDVQPLLRAAELLIMGGDMDAALGVLQPTVYNTEAKSSPINRLAEMSEWRQIAQILEALLGHEAAITRPTDRLAVRLVLGTAYERMFDYANAQPQLDSALQLAQQLADLRAEGFILSRIANIVAERGDSVASLALFYEALAVARHAADRMTESTVLCNIGYTYKEQGRIRYAITFYEEAWKIARRTKDVWAEAWYGLNLVAALLATGDNAAALAFINQYLPRTLRMGGQDSAAYILVYKGEALAAVGRADAARVAYAESLAVSQKAGLSTQQILAHVGLAELALAQADLGRAGAEVTRAESETALAMDGGTSRPQVFLAVINVRAGLCYVEGDLDKAALYYWRMRVVAAESGVAPFEAIARIGLARILRDKTDFAAALIELLRAYAVIADSEHRAHTQTVAALTDLAAAWPSFAQHFGTATILTIEHQQKLGGELGL